MNAGNWCVYLILCKNGAFYCGISNRSQERFTTHLSGKGAKYTRLNKPVEMRIVSDGLTKSEALKRKTGIEKSTAEQERGLWAEAETLAKGQWYRIKSQSEYEKLYKQVGLPVSFVWPSGKYLLI